MNQRITYTKEIQSLSNLMEKLKMLVLYVDYPMESIAYHATPLKKKWIELEINMPYLEYHAPVDYVLHNAKLMGLPTQ